MWEHFYIHCILLLDIPGLYQVMSDCFSLGNLGVHWPVAKLTCCSSTSARKCFYVVVFFPMFWFIVLAFENNAIRLLFTQLMFLKTFNAPWIPTVFTTCFITWVCITAIHSPYIFELIQLCSSEFVTAWLHLQVLLGITNNNICSPSEAPTTYITYVSQSVL